MLYPIIRPIWGRFLVTHLQLWSLFHSIRIVSADLPTTTLSNGVEFPLVGMGVGNLQHDLIESQISSGLGEKMNYRMIDTAHASHNENLIFHGIQQGLSSFADSIQNSTAYDGGNVVHVITKVWYTHLGYERTKISVKESLEQLNSPNISVHILIHWPRCRDDIPWMDCEAEENLLPAFVKEAGPPPHLNEDAYLESWRALEDIYMGKVKLGTNLPSIASIGISNFDLPDLKELIANGRIVPHIMQGNSWSYVFEPALIYFLYQQKIHFQVYNVMNGIHSRSEITPMAFRALGEMARTLSDFSKSERQIDAHFTQAQLLLKWFVQNKISVIPRTRSLDHLQENSPGAIAKMPNLTPEEEEQTSAIVRAMFEGHDFDQPQATFVNTHDENIHIFWKDIDGREHPVKADLGPGDVFETYTHTGHVFVAYDSSQLKRKEFQVKATYNQVEKIHIDELIGEL